MDCPVCGCQDTKFVSGIGKATRRPWSAYDCTNPVCKNEKGFQTRTFVNAQAGQAKFPPKAQAIFNPKQVGNLGPTIADIMKELKKMQDFMGMVPPIDEVNKELDIEANQSPF